MPNNDIRHRRFAKTLMHKRPSEPELEYFASLLKNETRRTVVAPASISNLSASEYIERLDYHGITVLTLQHRTLASDVVEQVGNRKAMMVANEALKRNALIELFEAFKQADLSNNILFKGSALAYTVYPQPWLRPRSDSDCLIDKADYDRFIRVFNKLGYKKLFAIEGKHVSYQSTFSKPLAGQVFINIDLHWRINNRQTLACSFDVHELIQRSQRLSGLSNAIQIPSAIDSILISSLHRLGHHQNEERLTWLYDIYLLGSALTDKEWHQLCSIAGDKKIAAITLDALTFCQHLFGLKIPPSTMAVLTKLANSKEPSQLFLNRDLPEWRYFIHDLKGLPGLPNKLKLMVESIFPSPAYVRQKMNVQNTVLAYVKRIIRGLRRIIR